MAAQTRADSNDFEGRFRRHFPRRSNDVALVVLKGHLLLEESVNRVLVDLTRRSYISTDRDHRVTVHQLAALERLSRR